jgi:hypothetical protein
MNDAECKAPNEEKAFLTKESEKNFHNFGVLMSIFFGNPDL